MAIPLVCMHFVAVTAVLYTVKVQLSKTEVYARRQPT